MELTPRAILLTGMEVRSDDEQEMNSWFDQEHVPDLVSCPGFVRAHRFVAVNPIPGPAFTLPREGHKYINLYELESLEALESPDYRRKAFDEPTPWTREMRTRVTHMMRDVYIPHVPRT